MSRTASWLCRSAILVCNIAAMGFLYSVAVFKDRGMTHMPGIYVWLAFVLACIIVHTLLGGKERSERMFLLVTAAFFAVQAAVCFIFIKGYSTVGTVLFSILFWMFSYYRCYSLSVKGTKQTHVTDNFDLSIVILLLAAACAAMSEMGEAVLRFPAAAAAVSFAALILARADAGRADARSGQSVRGSSLIVGSVIVIAGAAAGATALFADSIRAAIRAAANAVVSALRWVIGGITKLLLLLARDRDGSAGSLPDAMNDIPVPEGGGADEMFFESEWAFRAVIIALIALIAVVAVVRFINGRRKLGAVSFGTAGTRRIRKKRRALKDAAEALGRRIRYIADCALYRNTRQGALRVDNAARQGDAFIARQRGDAECVSLPHRSAVPGERGGARRLLSAARLGALRRRRGGYRRA